MESDIKKIAISYGFIYLKYPEQTETESRLVVPQEAEVETGMGLHLGGLSNWFFY